MVHRVRTALRDESGFTLVEVVFAAFILFFAMTALIGLMGATTNMGASAKSRSVLTNVISGEMDRIRSLPFDEVGVGTAGGGLLPASKTFMKDGFSVTLTYTVTDRTSQNGTKEVSVSGVATRAGFATVSSSAFSAIRNRVGGKTNYSATNAPLIDFTSDTPAADTIVYGKKTLAGNDLIIGARATSEDAKIVSMHFKVDTLTGSNPLRDGNTIYADNTSMHVWDPALPDVTWSYGWDTRQVIGNPAVPNLADGRRTVTIMAYDDRSRPSSSRSRTFIVDNYPPGVPGDRVMNVLRATNLEQSLQFAWSAALDGTDPAPGYECELYENDKGTASFAAWTRVGVYTAPQTVVGKPLSVYAFRVRALSPRNTPGEWGNGPAVCITQPLLTGSHEVLRTKATNSKDTWKYTSSFTLAKPTLPYSAITIEMERAGGGAANALTDITAEVTAKWAIGQTYSSTEDLSQTISRNSSPTQPEYRLKVTVTPQGYGGGTPVVVYSNYAKGQIPNISNTSPAATNLAYETRW